MSQCLLCSSRTCLEVEAAWPCFAMQLVRIIEADLDATCIQGLTSIKIPSLRLVCARYNCIVRYWRRLGHLGRISAESGTLPRARPTSIAAAQARPVHVCRRHQWEKEPFRYSVSSLPAIRVAFRSCTSTCLRQPNYQAQHPDQIRIQRSSACDFLVPFVRGVTTLQPCM